MTLDKCTNLFELLELPMGNLAIKNILTSHWGGEVAVEMIYRHPPEEKAFTLRFTGIRSTQWIVIKTDSPDSEAQLLTHDLGEGNYQRTARFATVVAEVIISYAQMTMEKAW